ncbi:MAG: hypothetical protein ACWGSD_06525 [Thermodesulfobacteriota bacterium]
MEVAVQEDALIHGGADKRHVAVRGGRLFVADLPLPENGQGIFNGSLCTEEIQGSPQTQRLVFVEDPFRRRIVKDNPCLVVTDHHGLLDGTEHCFQLRLGIGHLA